MRQRICHLLAVVLLTSMAGLYGADEGGAIHAVNLRSEYMTNPSGIDVVRPLLSWVPESRDPSARSLQQTAYQVLVSSSVELLARNTGDVWDSGKVIIQPRQTGDARDLIVTEPSEQKSATSSLCRITLSNGRVLSVFARDGEGQVQAPSFSGDAQLVVTLESAGGIVNGLVIKGREAAGSHAFDARPSQTAIRTPILSPSNFKWIQSASEISPSYSDVLNGQNHSGDSAPKR